MIFHLENENLNGDLRRLAVLYNTLLADLIFLVLFSKDLGDKILSSKRRKSVTQPDHINSLAKVRLTKVSNLARTLP